MNLLFKYLFRKHKLNNFFLSITRGFRGLPVRLNGEDAGMSLFVRGLSGSDFF